MGWGLGDHDADIKDGGFRPWPFNQKNGKMSFFSTKSSPMAFKLHFVNTKKMEFRKWCFWVLIMKERSTTQMADQRTKCYQYYFSLFKVEITLK